MKKSLKWVIFLMVCCPFTSWAQQTDTLIKKLDSLNNQPRALKRNEKDSIRREFYNQKTRITFSTYFILLGSDLKQQVTAPFRLKGKDWNRVAQFGLLAAASLLIDKPVSRFAVDLRTDNKGVVNTSKYVTNFGGIYEVYTLAALGSYGFLFKNEKIKTTTFLATQAYLTSAAIFYSIKFLSGRQRPYYYDPVTNKNSPAWHGPFYQFGKDKYGNKPDTRSYSSFPSGHTSLAFAAATVYAMEYSDRPLIPILSYSAASLIGLSRITENKHWTSDVLIGGILGHLIGKQVVNNYHRYAKIKSQAAKKKNVLSFSPQYLDGRILPGFKYQFN